MLLWKIGQQKNSVARHGVGKTGATKLLLSLDGIWGLDSIWLSGASLGLQPQPFTTTYPSRWGTLWEPTHSSPPHDTMQRLDNDATICIVVYIDHDHCAMRLLLLSNNRRKDWLILCGCLLPFLFFHWGDKIKELIAYAKADQLIAPSTRFYHC